MSAGGRRKRRNGLQGRYCFVCFFRPPEERKNPDWSDLMNYLIHPSDWSATCHSKPQRPSHIYSIFNKVDKSGDRFEEMLRSLEEKAIERSYEKQIF